MRALLRTLAVLALLPWLGVVYLLVTGAASWSSAGYAIAAGVLLGGLVTLPDPERREGRRSRPRGLSRGAVVAIAAVAVARALVAGEGRRMSVVREGTADASAASRLVNRLVDEGDVAVAGARLLFATDTYRDDHDTVVPAMMLAYRELRRAEGDAPSPFVATYLGLERSAAFDLVMIEPPLGEGPVAPPRSAVVFLHGFAGGFDLPCWQIAGAVAASGSLTACPSTRWVADWWSPEGEATLRRTVDVLHGRGIERIVLAGLSNGGFGASRLAPRMKGTFAGLVLISGAAPDAPAADIPTLVLHGTRDTVVSFELSRRYAARTGAKLVGLDAGHFAMLVRGREADAAVGEFVATRALVSARH